jgi:dihydrodipicolinate synthase/N-acetylneuraminate lyase
MKMPRPPSAKALPAGVFAAIITPRREGEMVVDLGAMLEVIDFVTARGVNGIALFGSTGEFLHFTPEERGRLIGLAARRSRVPLLANVSHSTLDGAIAMAEEAAGSGAAAVLVMPPYYFRYDPGSLRAFFLELGAEVARWTPVYLYNIPAFTNPIPIELAEELLRSGYFAGIKDSSGEWSYLERLIRLRAEAPVTVLCGDDRLFARARQAGAQGVVSGVAAAVPELLVALERALLVNDGALAERFQARLEEFISWIDRFPAPVGIREAAAVRGVKTGESAAPLGEEGRAALEQFRNWFRAWLQTLEYGGSHPIS